jgi:hypothetical protein
MHYRRLFCSVALTSALLSTMAATAQVVDFGKYPSFSGQWSRPAGNPNNWLQVAGTPPYKPESERKFAEIQAISKQGSPANWPSTFCVPTGWWTCITVSAASFRGDRPGLSVYLTRKFMMRLPINYYWSLDHAPLMPAALMIGHHFSALAFT